MKKAIIFGYKGLCVCLLAALLLQSCEEEEVFDVRGATENKVYLNTQTWAPITAPNNSRAFKVVNTPIGSVIADGSELELKTRAQCTHPATTDIKVRFTVDNSLVMDGYASLPVEVPVTLTNTELIIPKGTTASVDSVSISIAAEALALLDPGAYMIPVRIASVDNAGISSNLMAAYVLINTTKSNCKDFSGSGDMEGELLSKAGWAATVNATLVTGTPASMLNTSTFSYWRVDPGDTTFDFEVDMAADQTNITGIRLNTNNAAYNLVRLEVLSSSDGESWTSQGEVELSRGNSYQYIKFYQAIDARYFKARVLERTHATQVRVALFDVYTN